MKKFLKIVSALALVTGLSSCLKEEAEIGSKPQNIVEFYTTDGYISGVNDQYAVYAKQYVAGTPGTFDVTVSYSGTDVAPQDITVEVGVDEAALAKYNTKAEANDEDGYELLPSTYYAIPTTTVVIKKGERRATFPVNVAITSTFDFSKSYALPLTIKSASMGTISGNFGSVLYSIGAKNKYDGRYTVTGTMVDLTNAAFTAKSPTGFDLYTITSSTAVMFDYGYAKTYGHRFLSSGSDSYYGSFSPVFTFDDAGNITKVVNFYGQPASNGRSAQLDPSGQNKFISGTPGTKGATFKVSYFLLQPGSTVRTKFDETWVYEGPRP
ncbi:DUF1735 domain-containing protein [Mucilaginibacter terrenus]|uniref:DUF1735 domain-containing protein n=1 Tax=Mucilaginibacter terrenus TaxID=2482727 RepID=A0A3E2NPG2_9SPHI|nr:DUF1735 domain-containing protein [Mucilaginibacter terrenus]RFZ82895.1 DUF1735 domain-containing protein [Mucilaginibacter terrenus]